MKSYCVKCKKNVEIRSHKPYMVVTKTGRNKYTGSWHSSRAEAVKFGSKLMGKKRGKFIITAKPKEYYKF